MQSSGNVYAQCYASVHAAFLSGMMDSEGRDFVGYFAPDEDTLQKMRDSEGIEGFEGETS